MAHPIPQYPLYNTTFAAYRLSPLYHGSKSLFEELALRIYAHRLRDLLRGDTVRGVDVGFSGPDNGRTGALESCTWELIGDEEKWDAIHKHRLAQEEQGELADLPEVSVEEARGIYIQLRYAKATHSALLLRDPNASTLSPPEGFTSLPLLLVRMPTALRDTFTEFLSSTFDTRIAPMKMRSTFLSSTLETLLLRLDSDAPSSSITSMLRGLQLQLSFPNVFRPGAAAPLRNIDISISRDDIPEFLTRGRKLLSVNPSLLRPQQSGAISAVTGPFTAALSHYLSAHLALPLSHQAIALSKIACTPILALGGDGKLKIFAPPAPVETDASITDENEPATSPIASALADFYTSLLAYASSPPLADGIIVRPALPVLSKGKEKERQVARTAAPADKAKSKRVLTLADSNRRTVSPKRRKAAEDGDEEHDSENERLRAQSQMSLPAEPPPPYELHDPARQVAR